MTEHKWREFWITWKPFHKDPLGPCVNILKYVADFKHEDSLHVIEYSAVQSLLDELRRVRDEFYELLEHTSSNLDNMQHYFDNKCVPTLDEVNQCAIVDAHARLAIARVDAVLAEWEGK